MSTKIKIERSDFSELSSQIAEKDHHSNCDFKCCGEHNDFIDFKKCPKCGMTEEIQDAHNDEVWSFIDAIEENLSYKYEVID